MSSSQLEPKGMLGQSMALLNSLCSSTAFTTCPEHELSHDISYISSRRWSCVSCVMLRYLWFTLLRRRCGGAALALVTQLLQRHDVDFANIVELPNWYKCLATVTGLILPKELSQSSPLSSTIRHSPASNQGLRRAGRWIAEMGAVVRPLVPWKHGATGCRMPHKFFRLTVPIDWGMIELEETSIQSNPPIAGYWGSFFPSFLCFFFGGVFTLDSREPAEQRA